MKTVKIPLTIERGDDKTFWGRVEYKGNLITDQAESFSELEKKNKNPLMGF